MADVLVVPRKAMGLRNRRQHPADQRNAGVSHQEGRFLAEDQNSEVVIHGRDGKIRDKDSYGNDPRDIPG